MGSYDVLSSPPPTPMLLRQRQSVIVNVAKSSARGFSRASVRVLRFDETLGGFNKQPLKNLEYSYL